MKTPRNNFTYFDFIVDFFCNCDMIFFGWKNMNNEAVKKELKSVAAMLVASFAFALSLDLFIVPNKIICGTLTGLSTLVNFLINNALGIGTLTIIFDIPILLS